MQSRVTYAGKAGPEKGRHHLLDRRAATILAAVIVGIYMGASTISEIDPFYRNGQARSAAGSYTIDGWRGADAVPPPISVSANAPMRNFGLVWAPASLPLHSDYPVQTATYYGSDSMADRESGDAYADDQVADDRDCVDCSGITPIPLNPPAEAVPRSAGCAAGDPACVPDGQDSEDMRGEVESAPPADF